MSLSHRKIKKGLAAHSQSCVATLNDKLGTSFSYEFDWSCLPESMAGWNWEQEDLNQLLYNSYYLPIEVGLRDLFADDEDDKKAILEQIKGFSVTPGGSIASFEFADETLTIKHTLGVNQSKGERSMFFKDVLKALKNTIENSLSFGEPETEAPAKEAPAKEAQGISSHRKIQKGLEAHSQSCVATLNERLGTSFTYEFDWSCLPEGMVGWNWEQDDLNQLLYNSYYLPVEVGLKDLFEDDEDKEEILERIKGFSVTPGGSIASFEFADETLTIKHTLGVNQARGERSMFFKDVLKAFNVAVEGCLDSEDPKAEAPKTEAPKTEAPKTEAPASTESQAREETPAFQQVAAATLSGQLKLRRGSKVIATFEPSGRFRGQAGSGSVATSRIELKGRTVGKIDGGRIRDRNGKTIGQLDGEVLRTSAGKRLCKIASDGAIRLGSGKSVGRVEGAEASDMALIAGYLFLIGSVETW
jgi:hypothetical protein